VVHSKKKFLVTDLNLVTLHPDADLDAPNSDWLIHTRPSKEFHPNALINFVTSFPGLAGLSREDFG